MFEFIRIQFILGNLTVYQVVDFAPQFITSKQAEELLNGEHPDN